MSQEVTMWKKVSKMYKEKSQWAPNLFTVDNSDDTKMFPEDDSAMEVDKTAVISGPDEYDNKDVSNSDDTKTFPEEDSAMQVDKTAVISGPHQSETKDSTELMVSHEASVQSINVSIQKEIQEPRR